MTWRTDSSVLAHCGASRWWIFLILYLFRRRNVSPQHHFVPWSFGHRRKHWRTGNFVCTLSLFLSKILASSGSPLLVLARRRLFCLLYSLPLLWFPSFFSAAANGRWSWQETRKGNARKEPRSVCHLNIYFFSVNSKQYPIRLSSAFFIWAAADGNVSTLRSVAVFRCHLKKRCGVSPARTTSATKKPKIYIFLFQNIFRWHVFQLDSIRLRKRVNWRRSWAKIEIESQVKGKCKICVFLKQEIQLYLYDGDDDRQYQSTPRHFAQLRGTSTFSAIACSAMRLIIISKSSAHKNCCLFE